MTKSFLLTIACFLTLSSVGHAYTVCGRITAQTAIVSCQESQNGCEMVEVLTINEPAIKLVGIPFSRARKAEFFPSNANTFAVLEQFFNANKKVCAQYATDGHFIAIHEM